MSDFVSARPPTPLPAACEHAAHGEAALLLVESLMHTLVADGVLKLDAALETAYCAAEVRHEINDDKRGDASIATPPDLAAALLERIASTFALDAPRTSSTR